MTRIHSVMENGRSSTRIDNVAPVGTGVPMSSTKGNDTFESPTSRIRGSAVTQPLILKNRCWYTFSIVLLFAITSCTMVSAQSNFSVQSTSYDCSSNIICLGGTHVYTGNDSRIQAGRLSLLPENITGVDNAIGLAYYNQSVKLLDPSTRQSASFKITFTIDNVVGPQDVVRLARGDGMTLVISANKSTIGNPGATFGIFKSGVMTPNKTVAVEFDTFNNPEVGDINSNHVSFDFGTIFPFNGTSDASEVGVNFGDNSTFYAWVEYSNQTQQLEVRVSKVSSRPPVQLLNHTVDLYDIVEEYMWVGFSSASGNASSNFYVGDWTFESSFESDLGLTPGPSSDPTAVRKNGIKVATIVGISVGISVFLLFCIVINLFLLRPDGSSGGNKIWLIESLKFRKENPTIIQIEGMPKTFTYKQLSVATKAFSDRSKVGQGGFGSVYRGVLPSSDVPVAVKKISTDSTQGEKEFLSEVSIVGQLRHRNLIQLLGWCKEASRGKYLLVYELMPNGSLDQVLFGPAEKQTASLSWAQRFNIVSGIAVALDYLHQGWTKRVIHRDIKSSNIMLDEEWNAKLGDFGLARLVDHKREASTTVVAGTRGYLAPEVAAFGRFTDKSDVFAFGAVVLEVACGRKALSVDVPEDEMILADWVWQRLSEGSLMTTVDRRLEDFDADWMEVMLTIGLLCSHPDAAFRPSMRLIVKVLAGHVPVPSIPLSKPPLTFSALPLSIWTDSSDDTKAKSTPKSASGSISLVTTNTWDSGAVI